LSEASIDELRLNTQDALKQIAEALDSSDERSVKAQRVAELVRLAGDYRWVGIYDVGEREISVIAWSGKGAPAYPRFPVNQGLSADAVSSGRTIVSNDVANDPRYLTAFGNTKSEIIVPIADERSHQIVGTLDLESDVKNAFTDEDRRRLEEYARAMAPLWK
jgi:putative methionine-R-sulfoxide reductase with GAF domain